MDETYQGAVEDAIRKAVLDVALVHHLVSKYTSLVAVDVTPARPTETPARPDEAGRPAAKTDSVPLSELAKGGTSGPLQLFMGLATIMLAWFLWSVRKHVA